MKIHFDNAMLVNIKSCVVDAKLEVNFEHSI